MRAITRPPGSAVLLLLLLLLLLVVVVVLLVLLLLVLLVLVLLLLLLRCCCCCVCLPALPRGLDVRDDLAFSGSSTSIAPCCASGHRRHRPAEQSVAFPAVCEWCVCGEGGVPARGEREAHGRRRGNRVPAKQLHQQDKDKRCGEPPRIGCSQCEGCGVGGWKWPAAAVAAT